MLLHELGHDALHRNEATQMGGFKEFNIFDMRNNRMEYEANLFASQVSLPDDAFLELVAVLLLRQQAVVRLVGIRDEYLAADFDLSVIAPFVIDKVVGGAAARGLDARKLTVLSIGIFDL